MSKSNEGLGFMQLDVYRVTRELVVKVGALKIADRELRDQATRAAASVLLQLSEGLPLESQAARRKYSRPQSGLRPSLGPAPGCRTYELLRRSPARHLRFDEAKGSVCEVAAAVDVAAALGVARGAEVDAILVLAARVKRMLWRLSQ